MARARRFDALRDDAYKRADREGATDRFPSAEVGRYVNQGGAMVWDWLIGALGPEALRADPPTTITTSGSTTSYPLDATFRSLISVRLDGIYGMPLVPFTGQEEPTLRLPTSLGGLPTHYQVQRHVDGSNHLIVLPAHQPNLSIVVDYVPAYVDMVADADTFDGINGWEDGAVIWAARCMARKDADFDLVRALETELAEIKLRVQSLAPKRDMHRARRVKDVRGGRFPAWLGRRWG